MGGSRRLARTQPPTTRAGVYVHPATSFYALHRRSYSAYACVDLIVSALQFAYKPPTGGMAANARPQRRMGRLLRALRTSNVAATVGFAGGKALHQQPTATSSSRNIVIAVSSVSGGGKTTLVRNAARELGAVALFFDDYAEHEDPYPPDLQQWVQSGVDVNALRTPQFAEDVASLRAGRSIRLPPSRNSGGDTLGRQSGSVVDPSGFIIIEEPTGGCRDEMAPHIDFVVVIDTPLEIALARRLLRDTASLPTRGPLRHFSSWLNARRHLNHTREFLKNYVQGTRVVYQRIAAQAIANCDLVLNGATTEPNELCRQLVLAVKQQYD